MLRRCSHGSRVSRRLGGKAIHWDLCWSLRSVVKWSRTSPNAHGRRGSAIVGRSRSCLSRIPWRRVRVLGWIVACRTRSWPGRALLFFLHFIDLEPIPRLRFAVTTTTDSTRIQSCAALRCSSPRYPSLPRVQNAIETWCNRSSCTWRWQTAVARGAKRTLRRGQGELSRYGQSRLVYSVCA